MVETTSGVILRTRPLTETSLIVQWLTPELGRISTVAKGARRSKSPYSGKLDLFYFAEFSFQRSRSSELHQLREVSLKETHSTLRKDIGYLQQLAYATALIEDHTETESPIPEIFALFSGFLKHLPAHPPLPHFEAAFALKFLNEIGLQPSVDQEKISPDLRQILRVLTVNEWKALARLKLSPVQLTALRQYLHGYLLYHLGKIPLARKHAAKLQK